jgi:type I restriction enzyme S subunit
MELMPGYKQTEVGVIPEDWEVRRLSDLAKVRSGIAKNSNASISNPVTVPYLRVANVQDGFLDLGEVSSISIGRDDLERYLLRPGDVLMNEGGDLDKLGRGAIWRGELKQCIHQNHVFAIRCTAGLLPEFLNAWASGKAARRYFVVAGKQTTNLASINKTAIGGLPIALPSPREQQQIAEALDSLCAHEASFEDLIAKKKQIKQAAMQELLTGKRRLPGFEGEWEVKRLKDIIKTPVTDGPHMTPRFLDTGVPFLSVNNLVNNRIDLSDLRFISEEDHRTFSRKCKPQKGDILLGKAASVGKVAIVESVAEFNIWSPIALVRIADNDSPKFIYYALQSRDLASQISLLTNSSSQGNIGMGDIEKLSFRLPEKEEQTAIASALSELDAELAGLEARMEKAQQIKQGMMQQLLTGKIRLT